MPKRERGVTVLPMRIRRMASRQGCLCVDRGIRQLILDEKEGKVACGDCGRVLILSLSNEMRTSTSVVEASLELYGDLSKGSSAVRASVCHRNARVTINGLEERNISRRMAAKRSKEEKRAFLAIGRLREIATALRLDRTEEERACDVFRVHARRTRAWLKKSVSTEALLAATVYAACRIRGTPRTRAEVAAASTVDAPAIGRAFSLLRKECPDLMVPLPSSGDYCPRFCRLVFEAAHYEFNVRRLIRLAREWCSRTDCNLSLAAASACSAIVRASSRMGIKGVDASLMSSLTCVSVNDITRVTYK